MDSHSKLDIIRAAQNIDTTEKKKKETQKKEVVLEMLTKLLKADMIDVIQFLDK